MIQSSAEIILLVFHLPTVQRVQISKSVNKFSNSHYIEGLQQIVDELLISQSISKKKEKTK
jgi:hypothetical protein